VSIFVLLWCSTFPAAAVNDEAAQCAGIHVPIDIYVPMVAFICYGGIHVPIDIYVPMVAFICYGGLI